MVVWGVVFAKNIVGFALISFSKLSKLPLLFSRFLLHHPFAHLSVNHLVSYLKSIHIWIVTHHSLVCTSCFICTSPKVPVSREEANSSICSPVTQFDLLGILFSQLSSLSRLFSNFLFAGSSFSTYELVHILATQLYLCLHLVTILALSITREILDKSIHLKCYLFLFFSSFLNHCNLGSCLSIQTPSENYKYSSFLLPNVHSF